MFPCSCMWACGFYWLAKWLSWSLSEWWAPFPAIGAVLSITGAEVQNPGSLFADPAALPFSLSCFNLGHPHSFRLLVFWTSRAFLFF